MHVRNGSIKCQDRVVFLPGYIRVSSEDQNTDRQLEGVDLDKTFTDRLSGKDVNRPELKRMLEFVREGDQVIIHSMDRLGERNKPGAGLLCRCF